MAPAMSGGFWLPTSAGGGSSTFVGAKARRSTNQSIPDATVTAVQLNATDDWDTDSIHDPVTNNTRMTIPTGKGGKWRFYGGVSWAPAAGTVRLTLYIRKNGDDNQRLGQMDLPSLAGSGLEMTVVGSAVLAASDYIELIAYHETGAARNISGSTTGSQGIFFAAEKLD